MRLITNNQNNPNSEQRGFSLLELLISMAITVIAVLAALSLMTKYARTVGAFTEVSAMEEARGSSETLLRADIDGAGYNLTRPSPSLAGTVYADLVSPDFYTWSRGTITKTGEDGWDHPANMVHALGSGLGSFAFTPPQQGGGNAEIYGPNGNSFGIGIGFADGYEEGGGGGGIGIIGIGRGSMSLTIYVNGKEVATSSEKVRPGMGIAPHSVGDSYVIKLENNTDQSEQRVAKIYRISRDGTIELLWTTDKEGFPSYPVHFDVNIYSRDASFTDVTLTGAPLVPVANNLTEFAPLPYDITGQLTAPIATINGGAGIITVSGDRSTDAVTTVSDFIEKSDEITVHTPQRGSFNRGDYVLVVDWGSLDPSNPGGASSALCLVRKATSEVDNQTLYLHRIVKDEPAWGRLFSSDSDHAHTYAAGSTLIKIQAPVAYALSSDSRLVRIEGDRASTVAFNVRRATFSRYVEYNSPAMIFLTDITLAAEGVETNAAGSGETRGTDETRTTIQFRSTPRALNLASNQLN